MGGMGGKYYSSANVLFWDLFINLSASCRTVVLWKKWSVNNFFWEGSSSAATFLLGWSVGVKGGGCLYVYLFRRSCTFTFLLGCSGILGTVFKCIFIGKAVQLPFCKVGVGCWGQSLCVPL